MITNVLPNLEHIIGPQPPIPEVGGAETLNRFNYLFRKFVRALCTAAHPVVIFIDDMQWADSASLNLLHVLMTDPECGHFMLVCAYRENEVSAAHPFIRAVDDIRETGMTPETIRIGNLTEDDLGAMLADALARRGGPSRLSPLSCMTRRRETPSSPTEFLKSLAAERLLAFDPATTRWQWDADLIAQKNIAENVVDLMAYKVRRLDPAVQETLRLASCIGSRFDLETLCVVHRRDPADEAGLLKVCPRRGPSLPARRCELQIQPRPRAAGRLFADPREGSGERASGDRPPAARQRAGSSSVKHASSISPISSTAAARSSRLAKPRSSWRSSISRQAIAPSSTPPFPPRCEYFETGISLVELGREPWKEAPKLTRELFTEFAEAAYLSGEFERMDGRFRTLLTELDDILDKVKPYEVRILAYKADNRFHDAIETGLEVLAQLGERFPPRPNLSARRRRSGCDADRAQPLLEHGSDVPAADGAAAEDSRDAHHRAHHVLGLLGQAEPAAADCLPHGSALPALRKQCGLLLRVWLLRGHHVRCSRIHAQRGDVRPSRARSAREAEREGVEGADLHPALLRSSFTGPSMCAEVCVRCRNPSRSGSKPA